MILLKTNGVKDCLFTFLEVRSWVSLLIGCALDPTLVWEKPENEFCLRARELFYYLKGGQVDYGEEHSRARGHSQFGPIYERGSKISVLLSYSF